MKRFITIDSGKSNTKVCALNPEWDGKDMDFEPKYTTSIFRTKYEKDTFEDDDPGRQTYLCEYDGEVYKIGRSATGEAELTTSKKTFIHKLCTMFAIAREVEDGDDVCAGIGIPVKDYLEVELRNQYREFILPLGHQTVKYKDDNGEIVMKTFNIVQRFVYPESIGAVYASGIDPHSTIGVIDFGHLNVNMTIFNNGEVDATSCITTTKGANTLVSGLSQKLSATYSLVNKQTTAQILSKRGDARCLIPVKPNKEVEKSSKKLIDEYVKNYVNGILDDARSNQWSVDYTRFCLIGGGTKIIPEDLQACFGEEAVIPEAGNMVNVIGFMAAMLARKDTMRVQLFDYDDAA